MCNNMQQAHFDTYYADALQAFQEEVISKLLKLEQSHEATVSSLLSLKKDIDFFTNNDPWESLSSQSTDSSKGVLRADLEKWYKDKLCMVSGVKGSKGNGRDAVIAAHLWPQSKGAAFFGWQNSLKETVCTTIHDKRNGMFLLKEIEEAYDAKRIIFICDPFHPIMRLRVLDPSLKGQTPSGCAQTFEKLEENLIKEPKITTKKRPSFRILSHHAQQAVRSAPISWLSESEKQQILGDISVISPPDLSPAK